MDRRAFIATAASTVIAALGGEAQPGANIAPVRYLATGERPGLLSQAFKDALRNHGWVEGQNPRDRVP
jgi:hypothetical protein